ncbi:MAG: metallophosphoesterase family protein [Myxococcales bacterium]
MASLDSSRAPVSEPMLLISDIHGRLDALDAVLEENLRRGVKRVYVAGDLLNGGPDPLGVWRRLTEIKAHCVRGISDSALCSVDASKLVPMNDIERQKLEAFLWTRRTVGELVLESLRRLPLSLRVPLIDGSEVIMVHGSPNDPFQEITQDMDDDEVLALVSDDPADVVVCGASHVPFQRALDGVHVVNVGSVGAAPEGRIAHYSILTPTPGARTVEQNWVEY